MSNIINTYLKIQKCTFSEYQNSLKDANTIYFVTNTLQVFIGEKEYFQSATIEQFEETLKTYSITEKQFNEDYEQKLSNININSVITTENLEWIDKPEPQDKDYVVITHKYSNTNRVQLAITIDDTNHNSIIYSRVIYIKDNVEVISNWSNEYLMWKDQLNEIQNDINNIENDINSIEANITQLQKESFNYVGWVSNNDYEISTLPANSIAYAQSSDSQSPFDGASAIITAKYTTNWKMQFAISTNSIVTKTRIVKMENKESTIVFYNGVEATAQVSNNYGWMDNVDIDKISIEGKLTKPTSSINGEKIVSNSSFKGATNLTGALDALGMETGTFGGTDAFVGWYTQGKTELKYHPYYIFGTYQILGDYCTINARVDKIEGWGDMYYPLPIPLYAGLDSNEYDKKSGGGTVAFGIDVSEKGDVDNISGEDKVPYLISVGDIGTNNVVYIRPRSNSNTSNPFFTRTGEITRNNPDDERNTIGFVLTYKCR